MKRTNLTKLSAAAFLFAQGNLNTAKDLAEAVKVAEGTIYKWVKLPEWDKALDDLKFTGDRKLHSEKRRDLLRDNREEVLNAEYFYLEARRGGKVHKKAVTFVSETLQIDRRRINRWYKDQGWEGKL